MSWFKRDFDAEKSSRGEESSERTVRTEGLWQKCDGCREIMWKKDLETTMNVCGKCGYHFRMDARSRVAMLFDDGIYEEYDENMESSDPLEFVDQRAYKERLRATQELTSLRDALISAGGLLEGRRVQICAMEPRFIGGSMGAVMGEKITRAIERSIAERAPLIVISASGGARMQEGAVSLMQMAKISSSLMRLDETALPYISVLTDPTTGGVTASLAMLGDLNIGEPGALIGFAGPRVIEQTIRQKLPEGFQRSEFLLKHGMLDAVVPRGELKRYIATALEFFRGSRGARRRGMTFAETLRFLYSLGHELKVVKWDLARIEAVLAALDNPHRRGRFIHVAGTNGKGSTCAMIASALRASGFRTGLYTSPHLIDPRERIQVDGAPVAERVWVDAFEEVHGVSERLLARDEIDAHPSFFETVTAMAFVAFAREGVEVVSLETGLGGRLDATNVVTPEVAVITPIDFDHEAFLGSSIESIAAEKAGILKAGRPAVFSAQRPEAFAVLDRHALDLDVPVTLSSKWRVEDAHLEKFRSRFTLIADEEIPIQCPLAGEHQIENARTATAALSVFGLPAAAIAEGIAHVTWPGRLERVAMNPDIILDGAHNPAGAKALAAYIRRFFADEPVRIVYGAMRDKAVEEVTGTLFPLAAEVILTAPAQPRAVNPESLAESIDRPNAGTAATVEDAIRMTREKPMTTFITGSLFLVGEARALLCSTLP